MNINYGELGFYSSILMIHINKHRNLALHQSLESRVWRTLKLVALLARWPAIFFSAPFFANLMPRAHHNWNSMIPALVVLRKFGIAPQPGARALSFHEQPHKQGKEYGNRKITGSHEALLRPDSVNFSAFNTTTAILKHKNNPIYHERLCDGD